MRESLEKFIELINLAGFAPSLEALKAKSVSFTSSNCNLQKRAVTAPLLPLKTLPTSLLLLKVFSNLKPSH
jgi:hypothetical protein